MKQNRQYHIDSLRGVAALIVVNVHYLCAFLPFSIFGQTVNYHQHLLIEGIFLYPPFGVLSAGKLAVSLFFILSGFVLSYSLLGEQLKTLKISSLIIKRPIRLVGVIAFSIVISSLLWKFELYYNEEVAAITGSTPWISDFWNGNLSVHKVYQDLLFSPFSSGEYYNAPLWTIKIELYGSFMVYLFVLFFGRFKYRLLITIFLIYLFRYDYYFGFFIGLLIADIMKNFKLKVNKTIKSFLLYSTFIIFIYLSSYPNYQIVHQQESSIYGFLPELSSYANVGYPMISAILVFIIVLSNRRTQKILHNRLLQFIGRISYALYVVHLLVIGSISSWIFLKFNQYLSYGLTYTLTLITGIIINIYLAWLITKLVDDPSIKLASIFSKTVINFYLKILKK